MKNVFRYLFAFCFMLVACGAPQTGEQPAPADKIVTYRLTIPDKRSMNDSIKVIVWDNSAHIHLLSLGKYTTPTQFDIAYPQNSGHPHKLLITRKIKAGEEALFNISTFKKGTYEMTFTAIAESVTFDFAIE